MCVRCLVYITFTFLECRLLDLSEEESRQTLGGGLAVSLGSRECCGGRWVSLAGKARVLHSYQTYAVLVILPGTRYLVCLEPGVTAENKRAVQKNKKVVPGTGHQCAMHARIFFFFVSVHMIRLRTYA